MVPVAGAHTFCPQITKQEAKSSGSVNYWLGLTEDNQKAAVPGEEQLLLTKSGWASKHSTLTFLCTLLNIA